MAVTVTVANSVPAGSLGAAFSSFSASGLFTLTGVEDTLTAHAGGTQAAALALSSTKNYHRISVCATAGDSVALPAATVGQAHFVRNDGAASCQVYGTTPDTIDDVATATGVALPAGVGRWFICTTAAKWYTDEAATTTGSGANVLATSPTLVTPNIGIATGTSLTIPAITTDTPEIVRDATHAMATHVIAQRGFLAANASMTLEAASAYLLLIRDASGGQNGVMKGDAAGSSNAIISDPSGKLSVTDGGPGANYFALSWNAGALVITNRFATAKTIDVSGFAQI